MKYSLGYVGILAVQMLLSSHLRAEDKIYVRGSNTPMVGMIEKVDDRSVYVTLPQGSAPIPRGNIAKLEVVPPPSLAAALKAVQDGKTTEAVSSLEPIYQRYRGLPLPWMEEVTVRLGDAYVASKDWVKARDLFVGFARFYPSSAFKDMALSGQAQALFSLNQTDGATKLLEDYVAAREKEAFLTDEQNLAMGRACVTLGRCYLAAKKNDKALEAFLKTTVLYYLDGNAVANAQYESALLFEKMHDMARAKGQLEELLKEFPGSPLASEAKKKLESFNSLP